MLVSEVNILNPKTQTQIINPEPLTLWAHERRYGRMNEKEKSMLVSEVNILRELKHVNIVRYKVIQPSEVTLVPPPAFDIRMPSTDEKNTVLQRKKQNLRYVYIVTLYTNGSKTPEWVTKKA